jgi:hypothetical protein
MRGNPVRRIKDTTENLKEAGLLSLETLQLSKCELYYLHEDSFAGMSLLRNLDLSHNHLKELKPVLFKDHRLLRNLDLSYNLLVNFTPVMFAALNSSLSTLNLRHNQLSGMKPPSIPPSRLQQLHLAGNPWTCDCHIRPIRKFIDQHESLISKGNDTPCFDYSVKELVCSPSVLASIPPWPGLGGNLSLVCQVTGFPRPWVTWQHNRTQFKVDDSNVAVEMIENEGSFNIVSTLSIANVSWDSLGAYVCTVSNNVGDPVAEELSLTVSADSSINETLSGYDLPLVVGMSAVTTILVMVALLACLFCYLASRLRKKGRSPTSSSFTALSYLNLRMDDRRPGRVVNPLPKPPRSGLHGCMSWTRPGPEDASVLLSRSSSVQTTTVSARDTASVSSVSSKVNSRPPPSYINISELVPTSKVFNPYINYSEPLENVAHLLTSNEPGSRASIGTLCSIFSNMDLKVSPKKTGSISRPGYVTLPRRPPRPSSPWPDCYLGPRTLGDGSSVGTLNRSLDQTTYKPTVQELPCLYAGSSSAINTSGLPSVTPAGSVSQEELRTVEETLDVTMSVHSPQSHRHHLDTIPEQD